MSKVIEFYHPQPKPPAAAVPEVVLAVSAGDILRELAANAESTEEILVLMRDKNGAMGLVSNLDGMAENLFFIKRAEFELLKRESESAKGPQGGGNNLA